MLCAVALASYRFSRCVLRKLCSDFGLNSPSAISSADPRKHILFRFFTYVQLKSVHQAYEGIKTGNKNCGNIGILYIQNIFIAAT